MTTVVNHMYNPRRVAAGRANRQKRGPLTEAGRQRLRAAALMHKAWEYSTGPTTPEARRGPPATDAAVRPGRSPPGKPGQNWRRFARCADSRHPCDLSSAPAFDGFEAVATYEIAPLTPRKTKPCEAGADSCRGQ